MHSSSLFPVAPVTLTLSDPARSTRFSFPTRIYLGASKGISTFSGSSGLVIYSTIIMNTAWDLLETSFILVEAVALDEAPFYMSEKISLGVLTAHSDKPSTNTPRFLSSLICRLYLSVLRRSDIISL